MSNNVLASQEDRSFYLSIGAVTCEALKENLLYIHGYKVRTLNFVTLLLQSFNHNVLTF